MSHDNEKKPTQSVDKVVIFYSDFRRPFSLPIKREIIWQPHLTAFDAIEQALGKQNAEDIREDLHLNNLDLIVSWHNPDTDDVSEIGGVGRLDWELRNHMILTIHYEAEITEEQLAAYERWYLENQ